jgi:hypothetical protein
VRPTFFAFACPSPRPHIRPVESFHLTASINAINAIYPKDITLLGGKNIFKERSGKPLILLFWLRPDYMSFFVEPHPVNIR